MAEIITTADAPIKLWAFHSHVKSCSFVFPNGEKANFVNGKYYTSDEEQANILTKEITKGNNRAFFIEKGKETIMSDDLDPINALRKQHRAELLQELLTKGLLISAGQSGDTGETQQGKLNVQSTTDIAAVAAGGDGGSLGVRLAVLAAKTAPQE